MIFESFGDNQPKKKNYYEILSLSQSASSDEIKKAFRKMAKELHPDSIGNNSRLEDLQQVAEAYEVLSDDIKRRNYDRETFSKDNKEELGVNIGHGIYKQIEYKDGLIIGSDTMGHKCLIGQDGKLSAGFFTDIISIDGLLIGKDMFGGEVLIDKNTGRTNHRSYDSIQRVGDKIIGKKYGKEEEIKIVPSSFHPPKTI